MAKSLAKVKREAEVKKFAEGKKFPRTLYKKGGKLVWGHGVQYSSETVENEEEMKAAISAGYMDDFHEALFGKEEVKNAPEKRDIKEDDF